MLNAEEERIAWIRNVTLYRIVLIILFITLRFWNQNCRRNIILKLLNKTNLHNIVQTLDILFAAESI